MPASARPEELNYHHYSSEVYDRGILAAIPGHEEMHRAMEREVATFARAHEVHAVADLGIGTGLTSARILRLLPQAQLTAIDYSETMLAGARKRLLRWNVRFILGDYAEADFGSGFDIVVSAISIHHVSAEGKQAVFRKIFKSLRPGGLFLLGDLVEYRDKRTFALANAKHYAHMVAHAANDEELTDWAYHHHFINTCSTLEDQLNWLAQAGFVDVRVAYQHLKTALIVARKP